MKTLFGYGGAANPNPCLSGNKKKGFNDIECFCNPFEVSPPIDTFALTGSKITTTIGTPSLSLSMPGISVVDLAAQLAHLRALPVVLIAMPVNRVI